MAIRVWSTHGEPIDRVAKRGICYEPEPEIPDWILRDRIKDGLAAQIVNSFNRIASTSNFDEVPGALRLKNKLKLDPLADAERIAQILKAASVMPELCAFCIRTIEGNLVALQRSRRWTGELRDFFSWRLSLLRRRMHEDDLTAYERLIDVARALPTMTSVAKASPMRAISRTRPKTKGRDAEAKGKNSNPRARG